MASEKEKKMKNEILLLRQQKIADDREIFKLKDKIRNLEKGKEQAEEKLEKRTAVHYIRLEKIFKRFPDVADYIAEIRSQQFEEQYENERNESNLRIASLTQEIEELNQTIQNEQQKSNELQAKIGEQEQKLINYEIQLKTNDDIIADLQNELQNVKNDNLMLQEKSDEMQAKNTELEQKICDYQTERTGLISTVADLTQKNDNLNQTVNAQAIKIEELQSAIYLDKTHHKTQLKAKNDIITRLQNEFQNAKDDNQMIQNRFNELQLAFDEHGNKIIQLEIEIKSKKDSNAALQTKLDTVMKSKDEQETKLQAEIQRLKLMVMESEDIKRRNEFLEFEKKRQEESLNDGNRFISIKNVTINPNVFVDVRLKKICGVDINNKIFSDIFNLALERNDQLFANIDYHLTSGKILVVQSMVCDRYRKFWNADNQYLKIENPKLLLFLVGELKCDGRSSEVSNLLKSVAGCYLKEVELKYQTLTLAEFKKLTSSKTLEKLDFSITEVIDDNGVRIGSTQLKSYLPSTCETNFW